MGKTHSKETFTQWDLDRFSNVTGIPRATVEKLHQEYVVTAGKDSKMDKKEFRRLYKELYASGQTGSSLPAVITEHDLEKMSDRVFKTFDADGSGKLTFEEFVNAYLLCSQYHMKTKSTTLPRDRFNYIMDHNNPTPGYITREHGEQVFNRLNKFYNWEDTTKTTTTTAKPHGAGKPVTTTWEQHWTKLDDGSGRVPQEKFVEYVTTSDDYKRHFNNALV
jgi:Ca2+-binding EF-hand superfamily protein